MMYLSKNELRNIGFKSIGNNVLLSRKASIYNPSMISIGSNVRIDDFCVLSAGEGGIELENFIHIGVFSSLIGKGKIKLSNFSNISSRVSIYSSNDDYSGNSLTNPMVSDDLKNVQHSDVIIGEHVIIGSGSVVLPGVFLSEGVAIGALSLVNKSIDEYLVVGGNPLKILKKRNRNLNDLTKSLKDI